MRREKIGTYKHHCQLRRLVFGQEFSHLLKFLCDYVLKAMCASLVVSSMCSSLLWNLNCRKLWSWNWRSSFQVFKDLQCFISMHYQLLTSDFSLLLQHLSLPLQVLHGLGDCVESIDCQNVFVTFSLNPLPQFLLILESLILSGVSSSLYGIDWWQ